MKLKQTRDRFKQATVSEAESRSEGEAAQRSVLTFDSVEDIESISKQVKDVSPKVSTFNYFSMATGSQRRISHYESYLIGPLCTNKVAVRS
jgi:hypothetical protein